MATLKTIRKRISSVRNTQKITRAMKMVAAAKLRRAQTALLQARPYGKHLEGVLKRLIPHLDTEDSLYFESSYRPETASLMVLTSDRGLCGGFNSNLLRRVLLSSSLEMTPYKEVKFRVWGRKGRDFFRARKIAIDSEKPLWDEEIRFDAILEMAHRLLEEYSQGTLGAFYLAYNGFRSVISQEIQIRKVLPLKFSSLPEEGWGLPYIYKPERQALFEGLLPRYIAGEIYLALLESHASELGARMSAMESATNNAKEMISLLTLQYNRARQAAITKELMDIVNGAEALK